MSKKRSSRIESSSEEDDESYATSEYSEEDTKESSSDDEEIVVNKRKGGQRRARIVDSESEDDGEAERRALSPRTRKSITGIFRPDSFTDDEGSSSEIAYSDNENQANSGELTNHTNVTSGKADSINRSQEAKSVDKSNEEVNSSHNSFVLSDVYAAESTKFDTSNESLEESLSTEEPAAAASSHEQIVESSSIKDLSLVNDSDESIVEASYVEENAASIKKKSLKSADESMSAAVAAPNTNLEPRYTLHFDRSVKSLLSSTICDLKNAHIENDNENIPNSANSSLSTSKSSDDIQLISVKNDPIVLSSSEENLSPIIETKPPNLAQPKIKNAFEAMPPPAQTPKIKPKRTPAKAAKDTKLVSQEFYEKECAKLAELKQELQSSQNLSDKIGSNLPDGGRNLLNRCERLKIDLAIKTKFVESLVVESVGQKSKPALAVPAIPSWDILSKGVNEVQPTHTGAKGLQTFNAQKVLTAERLKDLHGSLNSRPREEELADNPDGLKIELMPHQRHALKWMQWREKQNPRGGILADDMGLGKTLSMISLVLDAKNQREENGENENDDDSDEEKEGWCSKGRRTKYNGGTLVVCPASLVNQWESEVKRRVLSRRLTVCVHHGQFRDTKPKHLRTYDMVVTTYNIVSREHKADGAIFGLKWHRIILDEGHVIRNYKAQMSIAACELRAKYRWILTGTPVHNKELDVYALLKFLRCSPFDDLVHWKRWIDKSAGGQERLRAVMQTLILRRTKSVLQERGDLNCLPDKQLQLIEVKLDTDEMNVYQKVMVYSRSLFAQFLYQRAERHSDLNFVRDAMQPTQKQTLDPNGAYYKLHEKFTRMHTHSKEVKSHEILTLLLRLRQICCHPGLIDAMLDDDDNISASADHDNSTQTEIDLLDQLNKLAIQTETDVDANVASEEAPAKDYAISKASAKVMQRSNPVFDLRRCSSKISRVLDQVKKILDTTTDKAIIVSQWSSVLHIIKDHLACRNIASVSIDGSVPVKNRQGIMDEFNNPATASRIMLLSLTAGGVGLNLVGANHLLLVDLHWNPQLEAQAQDRIYRVGQKKSVNIYKFMCVDTVEERIKGLQEKKLEMANCVLDGTKASSGSQLTMADLKGLFGM